MKLRVVSLTLFCSCVMAAHVSAATITEFTGGTAIANLLFSGQSITTPAGPGWGSLSFNFFSDTSGGTTPSAAGTLFLLSSEYLGTPSALSSATPGFLAQSTSIIGNVWFFDPGVVILGSTQYFLYSNAALLVSGENSTNAYPGGTFYVSPGAAVNYFAFAGDANFRLSGTPVPEPATLLLLGTGLAAAGVRRRMKKRA